MRMNLSSAYDVRAEDAVHVNLCLCQNFPNVNFSSEEWYYANDVSYGIMGGGRRKALAYLAYTGQVCAAEHKVLRIKQGVEFYY